MDNECKKSVTSASKQSDGAQARSAHTYRESGKHLDADTAEMTTLDDLPAELRNHIYTFAREEDNGAITPTPPDASAPQRLVYFVEHTRMYFALTQVCRSLREEFGPMYAKHTKIWIDIGHLQAYIDSHFPCQDPSVMAGYFGKTFIDSYLDRSRRCQGIDILPLLKLLANAPGIQCRFEDKREHYVTRDTSDKNKEINEKVLSNRDQAWLKCIEAELERVEYSGCRYDTFGAPFCSHCPTYQMRSGPDLYLKLIFKTQCRKSWGDDGQLNSEGKGKLKHRFLQDMGISGLQHLEIIVEAVRRRSQRAQGIMRPDYNDQDDILVDNNTSEE